jgi:Na+-transporting methylmalonyl-CoA/oxaloacetate decarboxylase gamma subunit
MNVEIFSYSLVTTVLGMLVVFLSLTALSVMMVVLKRIFTGEGETDREIKPKRPQVRGGAGSSEQTPVWVPAAVAAYLAEEQEPDRLTADPWDAVTNRYDPWIVGGSAGKRGV